jgi:hypothetical protein
MKDVTGKQSLFLKRVILCVAWERLIKTLGSFAVLLTLLLFLQPTFQNTLRAIEIACYWCNLQDDTGIQKFIAIL